MAPSVAYADDWSIRSTQSETVEANNNLLMTPVPATGYGSYSTLTTNAEDLTPTSKLDLDGTANYRKYTGPAFDTPEAETESLSYNFKGHYELTDKDSKFDREFVEASWSQTSSAFALLDDLGVVTQTRGFLDRATYSGGIDRSLSPLDNLSLFATLTSVSFEPSAGGVPFTDTLARGSWQHSFSSIVSASLTSETELLNFDNATNTQIQLYRNQVGTNLTLSPVLSFKGNIGAIYIVTEGGSNSLVTPVSVGSTSSGSVSSNSTLLTWIGDAELTYKMLKNTTLTLDAKQTVAPSIVGSLFKTDLISASLNHTINSSSSLSFAASATESTSTTTTPFVSGSVTYAYKFTRDWSALFTYRYQHRFESTGGTGTIDPITGTPTVISTSPGSSNSIMVTVSHSYTVLPAGS